MTELGRWLVLLTGGTMALGTALSLSHHTHWGVRLWDFPRVQIALIAIASAAAHASLWHQGRTLEWAWLAAVALAVGWQLYKIFPYTPLAPKRVQRSRAPRPDSSLRLLISNVLMENDEHGRVLEAVRRADPDVVLAMEVNDRWNGALEPLARDYPHQVRYPQENWYGIVLFSRLPLHRTRIDFLVQDDIPSIYAEVELPGGERVVLHGLHPRPPEPVNDQDSTARDAELVLVGRAIGESKQRPTVVAGDLNDVAWSRTTELFIHLSGLLDPRKGRGFYNSYNAKNPLLRYPLDHVFHSNHFRLVRLERREAVGSDHFPILVELSLEQDARASQPEPLADRADHEEASERLDTEAEAAATGADRPKTG